jgi:hypothetical protein
VRVDSRESPWDHLLETADRFVQGVARDRWVTDVPIHDVVGGMCRNAVDGAVRQAVINMGIQQGVSVGDALARLDERGVTRSRLKHVIELAGGRSSLPLTAECEAQHLSRWNKATHGHPDALRDPRDEIAIAAAVCSELQACRP